MMVELCWGTSAVNNFFEYKQYIYSCEVPGSVVGIVTRYGLDGLGSIPGGSEIFRTYPDRPWSPPSLLYNVYWAFPGGKGGRGVTLTTHPHLVPRS